jgi:hypothetical protein
MRAWVFLRSVDRRKGATHAGKAPPLRKTYVSRLRGFGFSGRIKTPIFDLPRLRPDVQPALTRRVVSFLGSYCGANGRAGIGDCFAPFVNRCASPAPAEGPPAAPCGFRGQQLGHLLLMRFCDPGPPVALLSDVMLLNRPPSRPRRSLTTKQLATIRRILDRYPRL